MKTTAQPQPSSVATARADLRLTVELAINASRGASQELVEQRLAEFDTILDRLIEAAKQEGAKP